MTDTATFFRDLEREQDPKSVVEILRVAKDDPVFASIARRLFDPFKLWLRTSPDLPELREEDLDAANEALCHEWSYFADFLAERDLTHLSNDELSNFRVSKAWPIYARILAKRFNSEIVSRELVAGELGTIAHWSIGTSVDAKMVEYPTGVQPFIQGTRCLALVSSPFTKGRDVWFVSKTGLPFPVPVPENVREAILAVDYSDLPGRFHDGLVLDGVINMAGYTLFDILPLSEFRVPERGAVFEDRAATLVTLSFPDPVHTVPTIVVKDREHLIEVVSDLAKNHDFPRCLVKRLQAPYPYYAAHYGTASWVRAESIISAEDQP